MTFRNLNIKHFLTADYLFDKNPPAIKFLPYIVGLFGLFIVLSFVFWSIYQRKDKKTPIYNKIKHKLFNIFFYIGMVGLMLCFFSWQQIIYLGSRVMMLALLGGFLIILGMFIYYRFLIFPKEVKKYNQKINYQKYLPTGQVGLPQKSKR